MTNSMERKNNLSSPENIISLIPIVISSGIAILLIIFILLIKGVIKTFKRQPIVAILCIIFLFPIYLVWAFMI